MSILNDDDDVSIDLCDCHSKSSMTQCYLLTLFSLTITLIAMLIIYIPNMCESPTHNCNLVNYKSHVTSIFTNTEQPYDVIIYNAYVQLQLTQKHISGNKNVPYDSTCYMFIGSSQDAASLNQTIAQYAIGEIFYVVRDSNLRNSGSECSLFTSADSTKYYEMVSAMISIGVIIGFLVFMPVFIACLRKP